MYVLSNINIDPIFPNSIYFSLSLYKYWYRRTLTKFLTLFLSYSRYYYFTSTSFLVINSKWMEWPSFSRIHFYYYNYISSVHLGQIQFDSSNSCFCFELIRSCRILTRQLVLLCSFICIYKYTFMCDLYTKCVCVVKMRARTYICSNKHNYLDLHWIWFTLSIKVNK